MAELNQDAKLAISQLNINARKSLQAFPSNFAKMEITPFRMKDGSREDLAPKTVKINPESYTRSFSSKGTEPQTAVAGTQKEKKVVEFSESISFDLWFDNTGAIPDSEGVTESIQWIETNLVDFDGEIHATRYVKLFWGALSFWGQLKSLSIQYMLFGRDGEPLRAKASLSFESITEPNLKELARKKQSPDLTHMRVVQAGDNLPLMCYKIYKDPFFYLEVAKANGMPNFTNVQPGQKIYFPPLKS